MFLFENVVTIIVFNLSVTGTSKETYLGIVHCYNV